MLNHSSYSSLFLALGLFLPFACSDKSFNEKVETSATDQAQASGQSGDITTVGSDSSSVPAAGVPDACDKASIGVTQAKLLSQGFRTSLGNQTLSYELTVINCQNGQRESLSNQPIFFDLNGSITGGFKTIRYRILTGEGKEISNQNLEIVEGSDLFGNKGNFAHWTTKNFSYTSDLPKLILEIILEDIQILPREEDAQVMASYLRVGEAKPVTQDLPIIP